jgi:hypothetical protein
MIVIKTFTASGHVSAHLRSGSRTRLQQAPAVTPEPPAEEKDGLPGIPVRQVVADLLDGGLNLRELLRPGSWCGKPIPQGVEETARSRRRT